MAEDNNGKAKRSWLGAASNIAIGAGLFGAAGFALAGPFGAVAGAKLGAGIGLAWNIGTSVMDSLGTPGLIATLAVGALILDHFVTGGAGRTAIMGMIPEGVTALIPDMDISSGLTAAAGWMTDGFASVASNLLLPDLIPG